MTDFILPKHLHNEVLYYAFIDNEGSIPQLAVNCLYKLNRTVKIRFIEDETHPEQYIIDVVDNQNNKTINCSMLCDTPEEACFQLMENFRKDIKHELQRFV